MNTCHLVRGTILAAVFCPAVAAGADVAFLSQERTIAARTADGATSQKAANDFGPFVANVNLVTPTQGPAGAAVSGARAGISCTFEFGRFRTQGALRAAGGAGPGFGEAEATVVFTFDLAISTDWRLQATSLDGSAGGSDGGMYRFELKSIDTGQLLFQADETTQIDGCDLTGPLTPGRYQVRYNTLLRSGGAEHTDEYDFDFRLNLPDCNGDVNCDGAVNGFDIEATELAVNGMLSDFCLESPDFNEDGALNGFDVESIERVVNGEPCP